MVASLTIVRYAPDQRDYCNSEGGGNTAMAMDSQVGVGGGGGVKGWHALYLHRRNVLFLLRRTKIFFERSKNNIDLH